MVYLTMADIVATLEREGVMYYWMLLTRDASEASWHLYALLVEAFPQPSNGRPSHPFVCVYDHVVALAGQATGDEVGHWLRRGYGEVAIGEEPEGSQTYAFALPPILSPDTPTIHSHQIASHLTYGATTAPWPYVQYDIPLDVRSTRRPEGPFIGSGYCQSFPNFHDLVSDLVYGVKGRPTGLMHLENEAVTVRIAQTSAWIDHILLSPRRLTVTVVGSDVRGARLDVTGSPDLSVITMLAQDIEQIDSDRQSVRLDISIPDVPSDLWICLSRDGVWLDEHWPTAERSPLGPVSHNVTVVPAAVASDDAQRTTLYAPSALTPQESEAYRMAVDERAATFAVSNEQFAEYIRIFHLQYRHTLDSLFPTIAPHIPLYAQYPFASFVLRIGDRGAIIGHRPSAVSEVRVLREDDLDPPPTTLNIFDIATRWGTPFVSCDLSAHQYNEEAATDEALRRAIDDALDIFWRIQDAPTFEALCLEILRLEGVELKRDLGVTDNGIDAVGTVYLREPAGFRRAEQWAFHFTHAASDDRGSVSAIRHLETAVDGDATSPAVICLMTSGDVTSIGKHVARRNERVRVWDRPILNLLIHQHLEAIAPFFPQYADAINRLEAVDDAAMQIEPGTPSRQPEFTAALKNVPPGKRHFRPYEAIGTEVWNYVFSPVLQQWEPPVGTRDKVQRRDVLFKNHRSTPFWRRMGDRFDADFIIVDFKNYKDPVDGGVIAEVSKYANNAIGRLVIVVSRRGADDGVPAAQIRTFRDDRTVVVVVSDKQLLEMVARKERGVPPEDVLEDLVDTLLVHY